MLTSTAILSDGTTEEVPAIVSTPTLDEWLAETGQEWSLQAEAAYLEWLEEAAREE